MTDGVFPPKKTRRRCLPQSQFPVRFLEVLLANWFTLRARSGLVLDKMVVFRKQVGRRVTSLSGLRPRRPGTARPPRFVVRGLPLSGAGGPTFDLGD